MKRCKKCGKIYPDSQKFCGECGSNLHTNFTYICNHCGRLYETGTACPKCHRAPDIPLPEKTTVNVKELQDSATQAAEKIKEKAAVAATVFSDTASSLFKSASEKVAETRKKSPVLSKTASDKVTSEKKEVAKAETVADVLTKETAVKKETIKKEIVQEVTVKDKAAVKETAVQVSDEPAVIKQEEPTGKTKKLGVAFILGVVLIGGIGGYYLLDNPTSGKNTIVRSPAKQPQQSTQKKGNLVDSLLDSLPSFQLPVLENRKKPQNVKIDQSTPISAFISFHRAISNKQYSEAYNILSPDYQRYVGNYDKFIKGYATTVSSELEELYRVNEGSYAATYKYRLKAVDSDKSGMKTRYFSGTATLVRINGKWRLDSTEAKEM